MSLFEPKFETYQDVRNTLTWWSVPVWLAMLLAIYFGLMPPGHRASLRTFFPALDQWVNATGSLVVAVLVAGLISQFLVQVIKVHDRVYDRLVVKWRLDYDTRYILPAILKALERDLPLRALAVAQGQRRESMEQLYFAFAGDRDTKIRKNLVVRFYEVITNYWLIQLVEVAALIVVGVDIAYGLLDLWFHGAFRPTLYWTLVGALIVWLFAHVSAVRMRPRVTRYTDDQITEIHRDHGPALRNAAAAFFKPHGIDVPAA